MQHLICFGDTVAIEGGAETVEDMAEDVCLAVCADHLCHVGKRAKGLLRDVDIAILADAVLIFKYSIIDMYVACIAGTSHKEGEVFILHRVSGHVLRGEMEHHGQRGVDGEIDTLAAIFLTETCPLVLPVNRVGEGQVRRSDKGDGVCGFHIGVAAHVFASCGSIGSIRLATC